MFLLKVQDLRTRENVGEMVPDLRVEGLLQTEPLVVETTLLLCIPVVFIAPPVAVLGAA